VLPVLVPATLCWLSAIAMASYVGLRRDKQAFHWLVLALLLSLVVWMTGSIVRHSFPTPNGVAIGVHMVFVGVLSAPPLWLLLASQHADVRIRGGRMHPLILALPTGLFFLALLTNDGHHLMLREFSHEAFSRGPIAYAGPLFWVFLVWAFACTLAGVALYLGAARRIGGRHGHWGGWLMAVGALLPLGASTFYVFQVVPIAYDTTPYGFTLTLALFSLALFRYQLLESLPLAREDVLRHLEDGVIVADAGGRVMSQNPAALRILGAQAEELRLRPMAEALARLAAPGARAVQRSERPPDESPGGTEFETGDGRCIEISGGRLHDGAGEELGRFALLRDRTEERRYERSVRQIQKLETVGALAAGVAREVNDPLAFVRSSLGEIERLGARVDEGARGRDAELAHELRDLRTLAEEARAGVNRIARLVEDMRRLFHGTSGEVNDVDLSLVVEEALREAGLHSGQSPRVVVSEEGDLPTVRGSSERLAQALSQLLENARTALSGAPDPMIRVALRRSGEQVELEVSDNGPGVPEHLRERIFDPFFTTRAPDQGTGLGLAMAFDIAREHGGVLEERPTRGRGATFVLRLPLTPA
jgi:PAS domain S-box-containing protein